MPKFKYDNCTSKQYVREFGWIPEARARLRRIAESTARKNNIRRLRYLTFCAEGALDVIALRNAKVIKRSKDDLYDTVTFFDFAPQAVDKTLSLIEGATGIPFDFFDLMSLDYAEVPDGRKEDDLVRHQEENDITFTEKKQEYLYSAFQESFPFDLINLDVERYVIIPSEQLPGRLLAAWDKMLEWQKRNGLHQRKPYGIDQFTLLFTTKIGPKNLPDQHRAALVGVLENNLLDMPELKAILVERYGSETAEALFAKNFDEFLKLAVPKALISRAVIKDWILDSELSYRAFEFRRRPEGVDPYTMLHYILHFRRCVPSVTAQLNPHPLPHMIRAAYASAVKVVFSSPTEDVDILKVGKEAVLRVSLGKLGVTEFATD
jgi:hypothetical protein